MRVRGSTSAAIHVISPSKLDSASPSIESCMVCPGATCEADDSGTSHSAHITEVSAIVASEVSSVARMPSTTGRRTTVPAIGATRV